MVNSFSQQQYLSWRSIGVWQNSNNFAEAGWGQDASISTSNHYPYRTVMDAGIKSSFHLYNVELGTQDRYFNASEESTNHWWQFFYSGNAIGTHQYISMINGIPVSESERDCSSDSLYSHAYDLNFCSDSTCTWRSWNALSIFVGPTSDYYWCPSGQTSYWVKPNPC